MQALLSYLDTASIPAAARPNVSGRPVRSLTLGMVNQRQAGYGISAATTHDQLRLLQLLVALTHDSYIAGGGPEVYTSICLNVDFPSDLHVDAHNAGHSWIVSLGEHEGGELFVERPPDGECEAPCSIESEGVRVDGTSVPIRHRWCRFAGSTRHGTLPYSGFRVSVVYFSVPPDRCDPADMARLFHLGFRIPGAPPPPRWPYEVFICTTRRSNTIHRDTIRVLLSDGSVDHGAATLCLRDAEDVRAYRRLGLRAIVSEDEGGLPEQRAMCTRYLPEGAWCLFLDDDVTHIAKPAHLSTHQLFMLAFLTARQRGVNLWGLNTSSDGRNLRDQVSSQLGLVNGYLFGVIVCGLRRATPTSDSVGGAAEDIERSLRYFKHSGLLRLNFATACARTKSNAGGLQRHYATAAGRQAAHGFVLHSLAQEFPGLIVVDPACPNGCRLTRAALSRASTEGSQPPDEPSAEPPPPLPRAEDATRAARRSEPRRWACGVCGKEYARSADMHHHVAQAHQEHAPLFACPACSRKFRRKKDMLVHVRMRRCHSTRGRRHDPPPGASAA